MVTANGKVLTLHYNKLQEDRLRCECDEMNYFQIFFFNIIILLLLPT